MSVGIVSTALCVKRIDEVRDETGKLTHKMCCICFAWVDVPDLWVCAHGVTWDMCKPHGAEEGCFEACDESP